METKSFKPEIKSIHKIQEFVRSAFSLSELHKKKCFAIDLIIEELVLNTINYGITDIKTGLVTVRAEIRDESFFIEISDNGVAFNPLEKEDPDIFMNIEDRQPGGLGIYLVKRFVKDIQYRRTENKNVLTLLID